MIILHRYIADPMIGWNPIDRRWRSLSTENVMRQLPDTYKHDLAAHLLELHNKIDAIKYDICNLDGSDDCGEPGKLYCYNGLEFWKPWNAGEAWNPVPPPWRLWSLENKQKVEVSLRLLTIHEELKRAERRLTELKTKDEIDRLDELKQKAKKAKIHGQFSPVPVPAPTPGKSKHSRKRSRSPREDQALDSGEDKASDSGDDQASGDYPSVEAGRSVVVCEGLPPYVRRVTYTHGWGVAGE